MRRIISLLFLIVCAYAAATEICRAAPRPRVVFVWLAVQVLIDALDGPMARAIDINRSAPRIDGRTIDDIVDYLTYTFVPLLLVWRMGWVPAPGGAWVAPAMVASLFGFANTAAKDEQGGFFLGFPSYWNVVAFYVVILGLGPTTTGLILVICSILVFVPVKYVYPSRTKKFRSTNLLTTAIWLASYAVLLAQMPNPNPIVVAISLAYLVYYAVLSLYMTFWLPRRKAA